jgi:hypothetical protein
MRTTVLSLDLKRGLLMKSIGRFLSHFHCWRWAISLPFMAATFILGGGPAPLQRLKSHGDPRGKFT